MATQHGARRNYVLTLEEIGNLAQEGGKPAETLMNVVALIARRFQTDVCSAYLLEPDRANLVLAATLGLRPQCIGTLRMALHEGLAGLVAEQVRPVAVEQVRNASALQIFQRGRRRRLPIVPRRSAHRSRRVCRACWWCRPSSRACFASDEIRMLTEAAAQVAPVVSEARTLDRFIAPAQERLWSLARNLWWSWDHDIDQPVPRSRSRCAGAQLNHNPISLLVGDAAREARAPRRRTGAAQPHQLRLPPPAGISAGRPHLGRDACRRSAPASGGVFLRRVRPARIAARSIPAAWACSRAITSRALPTWTFR